MKPAHVAVLAIGAIAVVWIISQTNWYKEYSASTNTLPSGTPSKTATAYPAYSLQSQYFNG